MKLADVIINNGPYIAGDLIPEPLRYPAAAQMNELRDELIELRRLRDDAPSSPLRSTETAEDRPAVAQAPNATENAEIASGPDLSRYDIEAMLTAHGPAEMWLGCLRCSWHAVYTGAPTLAELNQRATEHTEVCK